MLADHELSARLSSNLVATPTSLTSRPGVGRLALASTRRSARTAAVRAGAKRTFDLVGGLALIVLSAPLLALLAALVVVSDPGPVVFRQSRVGRDGLPFRIFKLRTMVTDAEERLKADPVLYRHYLDNDHKLPCGADPRVTAVGRFLRTTSLDELPQLFNVVAGSMSLVGPRPVLDSELAFYGPLTGTVLSVRPGMTGLWQVAGRSAIGYPERARLDAEDALSWSLLGDVAILGRTVAAVLRRTGAH